MGHRNLKYGNITTETLKEKNLRLFEADKQRIYAFPLVYQIVKEPESKFIELDPKGDVKCHFQVFNSFEQVFIQLMLRREDSKKPNFYTPVSIKINNVPTRKRIDIKEVEEVPFNDGWN